MTLSPGYGALVGPALAACLLAGCGRRPPVEASAVHPVGTVDFPVGCSAAAQVEFNLAVALLHHMTYPQARDGFRRVAVLDPGCAMAQWGIAMTLFQPLWPTRPAPAALQQGWDAVQRAESLGAPTERERRFIGAAEAFFREPTSSDYWLRIHRWAEAEQAVYAADPDDPEAASLYALALLAIAPTDSAPRARADQAAEILLRVYARYPGHPGAMHYLVHANDMPGREREALDITRGYEAIAPENPHALHMPTHIYTRLGDWDAVIRGNLRAADAALRYPTGATGELVWDEFPHAIEYLVYAYLQQGDDAAALGQLQRLLSTDALEPSFKTAFHLASIPARYALERQDWEGAAGISPRTPATLPWDRFGWPEAISWFAHGLGAVHLGQRGDAAAALDRLAAIEASTRTAGEEIFARNVQLLHLELAAWIVQADGQPDSSRSLMRQAAALELRTPKHAVTPAPTLPAEEQLGDLLQEQRMPAEALAAYRRSLALYPRRFNSLLGAARSARQLEDGDSARSAYAELLRVAAGGSDRPALSEARDYLSPPR